MAEMNAKANLEYDLNIVKEEIKLEPYLDNIKSEFGDDILYNTEQKHNCHETNTNINQNFQRNTKEQIAIIASSAHEGDKIKIETTDKVNPFNEDLDIVIEEIKLEPYLGNIKSEFGDDILYNTEQKHFFNETNTNICQNYGRNTRNKTTIIENTVHGTDKIKVETTNTLHEMPERTVEVVPSPMCRNLFTRESTSTSTNTPSTNICNSSGRARKRLQFLESEASLRIKKIREATEQQAELHKIRMAIENKHLKKAEAVTKLMEIEKELAVVKSEMFKKQNK